MKKWVLALVLTAMAVHADVYQKGTASMALTVGGGTAYNNSYTIVGVGANYFVLEGLSIGLGYRGWFGPTPTLNEIDVPVTYYVPLRSNLRPYGGAFYRYTFVGGDYSNFNTYGVRAGLSFVKGNGYIAAGWVQEWYGEEGSNVGTNGYPEITAGISF